MMTADLRKMVAQTAIDMHGSDDEGEAVAAFKRHRVALRELMSRRYINESGEIQYREASDKGGRVSG